MKYTHEMKISSIMRVTITQPMLFYTVEPETVLYFRVERDGDMEGQGGLGGYGSSIV